MKLTKKQRRLFGRLCAALVIFFALLIAEHAGLFPAVFDRRPLALLLYLIPYLLCGTPVLRNAALGVKNRQPFDESFLMVIATFGAFVTGEYAEAAAVMLFYQVGEWFQSVAVDRARGSIRELMALVPESANRVLPDGSVEEIEPDEIDIGDTLLLRPGEKVPVDATVISGESLLDTAALTGESVPRTVKPGSAVVSGCINGAGLLRLRAEKRFEDSTAAKVLELVENASERKSRTETFITRFARHYTPAVVIAALLLAVIPSLVTGAWRVWFYRACAFLVISCPCALVISVPLAFFGGIGAASRMGVLIKGANYLEALAEVKTVVTDKTGTLTEGVFRVQGLYPAPGVTEQALIEAAAAAEGAAAHPIAAAIRDYFASLYPDAAKTLLSSVAGSEDRTGKGALAEIGGHRVAAGSAAFLSELGIAAEGAPSVPGAALCFVAQDQQYLGAIAAADGIKPGADAALSALRRGGVSKIVMLSGDRCDHAEAVGEALKLDAVYAELLPQDKVRVLEQLLEQKGSGTLAYLGDGINDAPVLSLANVGVAMGSLGSDAAIEAADVVIMDDDLRRLGDTVRLGRETLAIARQNIVFALAVKAAILLLGALGLVGLWAAVFADVGVAVICILNSMRLLAWKARRS